MNFDFSDEQKFLKDQVRKYLSDQCPPEIVRAVLENPDLPYHKDLWEGVKEMGWLGTAIPEEYGGLGLGMLELCVIAEELGRVLAPIPFSSSIYLFAEAMKLAGSEEQKQMLLPKIASGEIIGCFAALEGPGTLEYDKLATQFDGQSVSGKKIPVADGDIADFAIVAVKEAAGPSLAVIDLNQSGVSHSTLDTLDPTRSHAELVFDKVKAQRLGKAGDGESLVKAIMDRAAVLFAFEQIGGADRALELGTEYAKERYAFGRPIGSNQAIKHKLADMWIKNQVGRSNCYYGAWALSADAAELPEAAAASRLAACEAYWYSAKENIQTHGGMGFTWEVDCHLYYRRAKLLGVQLGGTALWKEKLISALERKNTNA